MASRMENRRDSLWVILDRSHASNSITADELDLLESAIQIATQDDSLTSIVIAGVGGTFSGGVDLRMAARASPDELATFLTRLQTVYRALELCPCPVIAAVNGTAVAGGFKLVLCCDIVIASREARFADGHAAVGLAPSGGSTFRLPRLIGPNKARELLYTGRFADADELERAGLVNVVVNSEELEGIVSAMTDTLSQRSRLTTQRMKELVDTGLGLPTDDAIAAELGVAIAHRNSHDAEEGLRAFLGRRAPRFGHRRTEPVDNAVHGS